MIAVEGLRKSFGKLEVLCGIDERIETGEKVVVIGPSGSGKSTFLRCLNLLETPDEGKIFLDDIEITSPQCDINAIRRRMGMTFQHFNLFPHLTVRDNMTLAPVKLKLMSKEEAAETAQTLLDRVGLLDKADEFPSRLPAGRSSASPLCAR